MVGTVSNLATLALIGTIAEQVLRRRWWLAAFWLPALSGELAGLAWQRVGAGNSVAVAGLCGATAVVVLRSGRSTAWIPAAVSVIAFVLLALHQDLHGAAGVAGLLVGMIVRNSLIAGDSLITAEGVSGPGRFRWRGLR